MKPVRIGDATLYNGDCLEVMAGLPAGSIDMVLTDPPYGTTACKWDAVIPFEPMWLQLKRLIKPNGAIVLFGHELFTAGLQLSNTDMYRYQLIWEKSKVSRFAQAKNRFLNTHENIAIFSQGKCSSNAKLKMEYYPQGLQPLGKKVKDRSHLNGHRLNRAQLPDYFQEFTNYPKSILKFPSVSGTVHPTQKPVALMEYLIKTYTAPPSDTMSDIMTVLDFTMGSGTTGVACANLKRKFIGIDDDTEHGYFPMSQARILDAYIKAAHA